MSLRVRLILLQVAFTTALLSGLGIYLLASMGGWTRAALDEDLEARAEHIARRLEREHGRVELEHPERVEGAFRVATADGRVVFERGFGGFGGAGLEPGWHTVSLDGGATARVFTERAPVGRGHVMVSVASPTSTILALAARFREGLIVALVLGALLAAAGAAVGAQLFLRPVRRLAAEVATLEAGSLDRRVETAVRDPALLQLTGAFNGVLDRLQAAFERQRAFVARASHALRTPLATVLAQTEVALRRDRDAAAYRRALEEIALAARDSAQLVSSLLALSRADAATTAERLQDVGLASVVDELRRLFEARAVDAGVTLQWDVPAEASVNADPDALREALAALLDNAIRYTPAGGRAGLEARRAGATVRLVVWDTGVGIPEDERALVFERFFRGREVRGQPGSGLGLSLVRAIAEAHGAALSVEPNPGGGTRILLEWPTA